MRARISQLLALCCFCFPSPLRFPEAYFRSPRGKQLKGPWSLGKLSGPHWLCPLCGLAPGSIPRAQRQQREGGKGSHLPHPPLAAATRGKRAESAASEGTQLLAVFEPSGLVSLALEKKGREGNMGGGIGEAGWGHRNGLVQGLLCAGNVLQARSTAPLQRRPLRPLSK